VPCWDIQGLGCGVKRVSGRMWRLNKADSARKQVGLRCSREEVGVGAMVGRARRQG
jgi:hypothetical protein